MQVLFISQRDKFFKYQIYIHLNDAYMSVKSKKYVFEVHM